MRVCRELCAREYVWMPSHELVVNRPRDGIEVEQAALLSDARLKYYLEKQVAELIPQLRGIARLHRIGDLIGFFDGVRRDRLERLLQVPRTPAVRIPEPRHDAEQANDRAGRISHWRDPPCTSDKA